MLYEVPEPHASPHQLVFMSDADKGLGSPLNDIFWCIALSLRAPSHEKLQERL